MTKKNLKNEIFSLGIRQVEMAKELGVSDTLLSKIINGWQEPNNELQKRMTDYLNKKREQRRRELNRKLGGRDE